MRILVSNPDTIGDVVLRQPMLRALADAGHTLMLLVRPLVAPIVPMIAPGAAVGLIEPNVYSPWLVASDDELQPLVEAARQFEPDVLLVAPFQWTALEERLAAELTDTRVVAMTGVRYRDPRMGTFAPGLRADVSVQVEEGMPEIEKNAKLAAAVLGKPSLTLPAPALDPGADVIGAADVRLKGLGLEPGGYWAACVGDTEPTRVRNWPLERWGRVLGAWSREHGRRFLLVGQEGERGASERVREAMGESAGAAASWHGEDEASLSVLVGLIARAAGYVGRDTGPMHIAAALGKPVLAVFGGGTWPRFLPAAERSVSVTVSVPCTGCGWRCHLPSSYCVKEVPEEAVLSAAAELERGEVGAGAVRVLEPGVALLERIGREGAAAARGLLGRTDPGVLLSEGPTGPSGVLAVSGASEAVALTIDQSIRSVAQAHDRAGRAESKVHELGQQLGKLRAHVQALEAAKAEHERVRAQQAAQVAAAREQAVDAEARATAYERRLQERTAELLVAREKLAEFQGRQQALAATETQLRAKLEAEYKQKLTAAEAGLRTRESKLKERLAAAETELLRKEAEVKDLRTRLDRADEDREALAGVLRKQQAEVALLRTRLNELRASRWRKLGQRLHLAMTLPWERDALNGTANGRAAPKA